VAPTERRALLEAIAEIRPQLVSKIAALTADAVQGARPAPTLYVEAQYA